MRDEGDKLAELYGRIFLPITSRKAWHTDSMLRHVREFIYHTDREY